MAISQSDAPVIQPVRICQQRIGCCHAGMPAHLQREKQRRHQKGDAFVLQLLIRAIIPLLMWLRLNPDVAG